MGAWGAPEGHFWAHFARARPNLGPFGQIWAKSRARVAQFWPNFGLGATLRARVAQFWPNFGPNWPVLAGFGAIWANFGEAHLVSGHFGPFWGLGRRPAKFGPFWGSNLARLASSVPFGGLFGAILGLQSSTLGAGLAKTVRLKGVFGFLEKFFPIFGGLGTLFSNFSNFKNLGRGLKWRPQRRSPLGPDF